jgi:heme exporter protein C
VTGVLALAAGGWAAVLVVLGLLVAPPDAVQGEAQRLMYVHVPAAWTAYAAFAVVAVCSVAVLLGGGDHVWCLSGAAAELGVAMTALTLAAGSLWGQAAWGTWWAWDPRLVSTAVLLLVYVGHLAGRAMAGESPVGRRRVAWAGLASVLLVPVVHFSVVWWRTLHQPATLLAPRVDPPIDPMMLAALLAGWVAFTLGGTWYVVRRTLTLLAEQAEASGEPRTRPLGAVQGRAR